MLAKQRWQQLWPFMALVVAFGPLSMDAQESDANLQLRTDAPAVLDAPLTITANLVNADDYRGPFYYTFTDDASPMHTYEYTSDSGVVNYTLNYPSKIYDARYYTMTVRVFNEWIWRKEIAYDSVTYKITKQLNGAMNIVQLNRTVIYREFGAIVSTKNVTKSEILLYDPHDFLSASAASLSYYWFINDTNYGSTNDTYFEYTFSSPGVSIVEVMVLAKIANPDNGKLSETDRLNEIYENSVRNSSTTQQAASLELPPLVKNGLFRKHLDARNPMTKVQYNGEVMLKHGTMLDMDVTCDGTGPWDYCWFFRDINYNATNNETCETFQTMKKNCEFNVLWYFRLSGQTSLIFIIDDGLSKIVKQVGITVFDVPSRTPISLIVIPIISSMIAVIACISGAFVLISFKRNIRGRETADFDFSCPPERDEELEYKTFWERLRDAALNALSNATAANDAASHVSSVSSHRSVQGPPVGIHYGSIT